MEDRWERRNGVREEGVLGREVNDRSGGQSRKEKINGGREGRVRIFLFSLFIFTNFSIFSSFLSSSLPFNMFRSRSSSSSWNDWRYFSLEEKNIVCERERGKVCVCERESVWVCWRLCVSLCACLCVGV